MEDAQIIILGVTAIIRILAFIFSINTYSYTKKCCKVNKSIELSNEYEKIIDDISDFTSIILRNNKIEKILNAANIEDFKNFNHDELGKIDKPEDYKLLIYFFTRFCDDTTSLKEYYIKTNWRTSQIHNLKQLENQLQDKSHEFLILYYNIKMTHILNQLESFSMGFIHNLANDDIVYQSLHQTFLLIIKNFYFLIAANNISSEDKYYVNLTALFIKWKKRLLIEKNKVTKQELIIRKNIDNANRKKELITKSIEKQTNEIISKEQEKRNQNNPKPKVRK